LYWLGRAALQDRDLEGAGRALGECLAISRDLEWKASISICLEAAGHVALLLGRPVTAARLCGALSVLNPAIGTPSMAEMEQLPLTPPLADLARAALGDGELEAAVMMRSAMPLERVIAETLTAIAVS